MRNIMLQTQTISVADFVLKVVVVVGGLQL